VEREAQESGSCFGLQNCRDHSAVFLRCNAAERDLLPADGKFRLNYFIAGGVFINKWFPVMKYKLNIPRGIDKLSIWRRKCIQRPEAADIIRKSRRWRIDFNHTAIDLKSSFSVKNLTSFFCRGVLIIIIIIKLMNSLLDKKRIPVIFF
jgi:hypothetical protein